MKKTVIELFAGVGGFRVGLNDIHGFNNNGKAIENRDWKFVGQINGNQQLQYNMLMIVM